MQVKVKLYVYLQQSMYNVSVPEVLQLYNVTQENAGWYTCLVSNQIGRTYQSAWLTVEGEGTYAHYLIFTAFSFLSLFYFVAFNIHFISPLSLYFLAQIMCL